MQQASSGAAPRVRVAAAMRPNRRHASSAGAWKARCAEVVLVVLAVDSFAAATGRTVHWTLEGRSGEDPATSDGVSNPSWYFVK